MGSFSDKISLHGSLLSNPLQMLMASQIGQRHRGIIRANACCSQRVGGRVMFELFLSFVDVDPTIPEEFES